MSSGTRHKTAAEMERERAGALTKATLECARLMGLSPTETGTVLGVTQAVFTSLKSGARSIDGDSAEAERADALVRVAKRLHALLGEAETNWRSWLRKQNDDLGRKPLEMLLQRDGCEKLAAYLAGKSTL